jgi:hypothetical protein
MKTEPRWRMVIPRSECTHVRVFRPRIDQIRKLREQFPDAWATDTEAIDAVIETGIKALIRRNSRKAA